MELKDCLHLYLPFYAVVPDEEGACLVVAINDQSVFIDSGCDYPFDEIKPVLRLLEDLADYEKEMVYHTRSERIVVNVGTIVYQTGSNHEATLMLLKMGVDIFGLIENGLAIRKPFEYRCDMCKDSGAVTVGEGEYATCPCVDDERN